MPMPEDATKNEGPLLAMRGLKRTFNIAEGDTAREGGLQENRHQKT